MQQSDWREWSQFVLKGIEDIKADLDDLNERVSVLSVSLENLKTEFRFKSGLWGVIGGAIPIFGFAIYELLKKHG